MSRTGRCEHGRLLRHAPELTTVAAATSGRPSGLHAMACHTPSMVAPSDPRWRAATVGGFIFGGSDPPYRILAVQDYGKVGITTIPGQLMGKSLSIPHIVVNISPPPPYAIGSRATVPTVLSQPTVRNHCQVTRKRNANQLKKLKICQKAKSELAPKVRS